MGSWTDDTDYKIGRTAARLVPLTWMGIPPPDQVVYREAAVYYVRGDQSRVSDGFISCSWIWDIISIARLATLLDFLDGAEFADVFIRTDIRDGTYWQQQNAFNVFSAIMWKPVLSGQEGVYVARSAYATQTVEINFRKLTPI